jgi:glycosyltransferase involved in cell wall biosynthesis
LSEPKIIAMYRIQNESRWIEKSLEETSKVCQEIVILDDCSTDNTVNICKKFPKVVDIYERKEPLPLDEVRDRNFLLKMALKRNPEYILALDGDEILMPNSKEILFEELQTLYPEANVLAFQFFYVWDNPAQIRYDGLYGKTWQSRLLKIDNNSSKLVFQNSIYSGNLHCGSIPKYNIDSYLYRSNVKILHYGNYDSKMRQKKYSYYNQIDPNSSEQENYIHIISNKGKHSGSKGIKFITLPSFFIYPKIY